MNTLNDPNFDRERELFLSALERSSAAERAAFLDGACGGDAALRARLDELVRNHANDSLLADPATSPTLRPSSSKPPVTE